MSREEVQKLLGGYATGTLTPEEQQVLFTAALDDQEIFDALANEQSLRDLMRDPAAKAQMLAALDGPSRGGWTAWLRRPWVAGLAMAGLAAVAVTVWRDQGGVQVVKQQVPEVAKVQPQPEPPTAVDAVSPAPKAEQRQIVASAKPDNVRRERTSAAPAAPLPPPPPVSAPAALSRDGKDVQTAAAQRKPAEADAAKEQVQVSSSMQTVQVQATPPIQAFTNSGFGGQQAQAPAPSQQNVQLYDPRIVSNLYAPQMDAVRAAGRGGKANDAKAELPLKVASAELGPAVKVTVIRSGRVDADPATPLDPGEAVKLRIVPNASGFLYVFEGDQTLASAQVTSGQQFETQALTSDGAGQRKFRVVLSHEAAAAGLLASDTATASKKKSAVVGGRAVSAAAPALATQTDLTVTLTWK